MTMTPDYARAARLAALTLLRFGVDSLPVDPGALLRQIPWVKVVDDYRTEADSPVLGAAISGEGYTLVVVNPDQTPEQRQFTLAHELGHIALRHGGFVQKWFMEEEADCFAFHLLVPDPVFARIAHTKEPVYAEQVAHLCFLPWRRVLKWPQYACGLDAEVYGQLRAQLAPLLAGLTLPPPGALDRAHRLQFDA